MDLGAALALSMSVALAVPAVAGVKDKALFDLRRQDGFYAAGSPVFDASGNLYATAELGGKKGGGTLFELSPAKSGKWTIRVLHDFGKPFQFVHLKDGSQPTGSLLMDAAGNIYGTTFRGGKYANPDTGGGIVYRLTPNGTETVLHYFANGQDAAEPNGGVISDASGNLYGASELGGNLSGNCETFGCGAVFEVSPDGKGGWKETVLYAFAGGQDGNEPYGGIAADAAGNLYGTTMAGGANGDGTVFELTPGMNGQWSESILYSFCALSKCTDGAFPFAGPVLDAAGNLYGTTDAGGTASDCPFGSSCGTVFELSPGSGQWTETVLHSFIGSDGDAPNDSLVFDASGNLYGTAYLGGSSACDMGCGTVFELKLNGGNWIEKTLRQFQNAKDGANPYGGVILDSSGSLYGATTAGPGTACGGLGCGAVYSIRP